MPAARRLSVAGWQAECTNAFPRRAGADLAGSGAAREDASPCLRLGAFEIRRYHRNCGGLNPSPGKVKPLCRGNVATTAGITGGAGKRTAYCGGDIRPPRADEAVSVRFKAAGCCILSGATADVS